MGGKRGAEGWMQGPDGEKGKEEATGELPVTRLRLQPPNDIEVPARGQVEWPRGRAVAATGHGVRRRMPRIADRGLAQIVDGGPNIGAEQVGQRGGEAVVEGGCAGERLGGEEKALRGEEEAGAG
jgi:hypothetical protein